MNQTELKAASLSVAGFTMASTSEAGVVMLQFRPFMPESQTAEEAKSWPWLRLSAHQARLLISGLREQLRLLDTIQFEASADPRRH